MINHQLDDILHRAQEVIALLSDPEVSANAKKFTELSREYHELEPVVACIRQIKSQQEQLEEYQDLLSDADCDADLRELAEEACPETKAELKRLNEQLQCLLLPKDPNDERNIILEIRAGTGGDEAALFVADLYRMYVRYAESKGHKVELMSSSSTGIGGYKDICAQVSGKGVYSLFKFESGAHRVQRVPETETAGRIHTSACTVAVLPEADEVDVQINQEDLRIDVFRASGPGGQSVNTTDSAIRITHIPSGLVVICQDEKSQLKNKNKAMKVLQARLFDQVQQAAHDERAEVRRGMVGSGDRSERIRTYNFPQGRITDHRINLTLYKLEQILAGDMDELIQALHNHHQAELLSSQHD